MHTGIHSPDVILAGEFQKHLSTAALKHGVIDQEKYKKRSSKINWTESEYNFQNDADVGHKYVSALLMLNLFYLTVFCISLDQ